MTTDAAIQAEVQRLCTALCEGVITGRGAERLEALVRGNLGARRRYIEMINLHAALRWYSVPQCDGVPGCLEACRSPAKTLCETVATPNVAACVAACAAGDPVPAEPVPAGATGGLSTSAWSGWRQWWASHRFLVGLSTVVGKPPVAPGDLHPPVSAEPVPGTAWQRLADWGLWSPSRRLAQRPIAASMLLAGLFMFTALVALGIIPLPAWQTSGPGTSSSDSQPLAYVARLTGTQQCKWAGGMNAIRYGDRLYTGQCLRLTAGVAQITYDDDARILIEGPAAYVVGQANGGYLRRGELTAKVPHGAIGFTVETPSAIVVDQGTEFGVSVDPKNRAEVHVFDGLVEAERIGRDGPTGDKITLRQGRAARFDWDRMAVDQFAATDRQFVRKITRDDPGAVAERQRAALARWTRQSRRLRQDRDLVVYYTFDGHEEVAMELRNHAAATAGRLNGILGDGQFAATQPTWTTGRWGAGKGALRFAAALNQRVFVDYDAALTTAGELSLVATVQLDVGGPIVLNRNARTEKINYQFGVFAGNAQHHAGRLQFGSGDGKHARGAFVYSDPVLEADHDWRQLAVTCRRQRVRFYLDGRPIGTRTVQYPVAAKDADLLIGRGIVPGAKDPFARISFNGRMDELAIFRRTLSPKEIAAIAEAGHTADARNKDITRKTI